VEIFIEYLLLLLKISINSQALSMTLCPGILHGQNVHFYTIGPKIEKGFIKI
jgi:hypothetical protein